MSRLLDGNEPSVEFVVGSLIVGILLGDAGAGVALSTLPTLGPIIGITSFVVGLVLSANRFIRLVANAPAGQILDRMGTRRLMIAGFVVQGLPPFGYVLGLNPGLISPGGATVFLLSWARWGAGSAFVFVDAFSTITHVTLDGNRGKWVGHMRGGQSLGFPAGLVVGGLVIDVFGYATAFAIAGHAGLFAVFAATSVLPDAKADMMAASSLRGVPQLVNADIRISIVDTVDFAVRFLSSGVLLSTAVLYAAVSDILLDGLSGVGVGGAVIAVGVVASSATTLVAGRYSSCLSNCTALTLPALGILVARLTLLALVSMLLSTFAGVALTSVGVGGSNPPLLVYLGDLSPADDVGKLGGVYNVFGDLGSTLGPLVAVPPAEVVGSRVEYLACVVFVVVVGLFVAQTLYGETVTVLGSGLS